MILGYFHPGSGLGNQLHRYVATRVVALDKGTDFSIIGSEYFKGKSFMNLDMGKPSSFEATITEAGKIVVNTDNGKWDIFEEKTNYYNPEFNFIDDLGWKDGVIIDGEFQDERYFEHRMKEIDEWLKVEPLGVPDDVCVINFRGGEYTMFPELFLTKDYWLEAINLMKYNGIHKFEVHTDDPETAKNYIGSMLLPDTRFIRDIGINWRSVRYAKYAIVANTSFCILPRLLQHWEYHNAITIAPRYWARRNIKEWSMPANYYKNFTHI